MSFGDVANADDVAVQPVERGLADGNFDGDAASALDETPCLGRGQVHMRIVDLGRQALQIFTRISRVDVGKQTSQRAAENLRGAVTEYPFAGVIERFDETRIVNRDDGVLDVVENRLQV